jgi:hypothetical protein
MGTLAARLSVQSAELWRMPALSPGSSMPVVLPRPKARRYSSSFASPTSRASMIVPTLLDLARMPVTVQSIGWWSCASRTTRSPAWMCPLTLSTVSGVAFPSCRAAESVTALSTEPGSKTSEMSGLPSRSGSVRE